MQRLDTRQLRAVDLVASGLTDAEVADEVGVDRATVWRWRARSPWFEAAVNGRREEVWGAARDRLRALVPLALDALEEGLALEAPHRARTALEVLKLTGIGALPSEVGPTDAESIIEARVVARRRDPLRELLDGRHPPTREEREAVLKEAVGE